MCVGVYKKCFEDLSNMDWDAVGEYVNKRSKM